MRFRFFGHMYVVTQSESSDKKWFMVPSLAPSCASRVFKKDDACAINRHFSPHMRNVDFSWRGSPIKFLTRHTPGIQHPLCKQTGHSSQALEAPTTKHVRETAKNRYFCMENRLNGFSLVLLPRCDEGVSVVKKGKKNEASRTVSFPVMSPDSRVCNCKGAQWRMCVGPNINMERTTTISSSRKSSPARNQTRGNVCLLCASEADRIFVYIPYNRVKDSRCSMFCFTPPSPIYNSTISYLTDSKGIEPWGTFVSFEESCVNAENVFTDEVLWHVEPASTVSQCTNPPICCAWRLSFTAWFFQSIKSLAVA